MAFGLSPKHIQEFNFESLPCEHFLAIALEAAHKLGWEVSFLSETGFIAYTKLSMSSWSEEITIKINADSAYIKSACTGSQVFDWGKNKKNVETFIRTLEEVKSTITSEEIAHILAEIKPELAEGKDDILNRPPSTVKDKITDFFSIFKPTEGYFISPILININILIFVAMVINGVHVLTPDSESLLSWGANFRPITLEGEWWRLLSSCFLHIGVFHLLLNMYALLYIGLLLEPYLGKTRFLSAYLITGIAASVTSLWWNDLVISAGASGAIFGMYGVFLALLTTNLLDKSVKNALLTSVVVFIGYNIFIGIKAGSGIDNAAHIGGLLSGLVVGYALIPSLRKYDSESLKISTITILTMVLLASSAAVYFLLPNDYGKYDEAMKRFSQRESIALEIYSLPKDTPTEKILSEINEKGISNWKANISLIDSLKGLKLSDDIHIRNSKLRTYCELRIKSYELTYKGIAEDTDDYEEDIDDLNDEIEDLIDDLSKN